MCDDLFDDSDGDDIILEKSWKKTIDLINTEGYRDGVDAGKEESVQAGFNDAFATATQVLFQVAKLRGNISGQLSRNFLKADSLHPDTESELQTLLQDVCTVEGELLEYQHSQVTMYKHALNIDKSQDDNSHRDTSHTAKSLDNKSLTATSNTVTSHSDISLSDKRNRDTDKLSSSSNISTDIGDDGKDLLGKEIRNSGADAQKTDSGVVCEPDTGSDSVKSDNSVWVKIDKLKCRYKLIIDNGAR